MSEYDTAAQATNTPAVAERMLSGMRRRLQPAAVYGFLSSYRLSVSLLVGLMILTWLGTLYQIRHGLYEAQKLYFESFIVLQHPADVWVSAHLPDWFENLPFRVPLPGGMTLMGLLAINLVCGGFVRIFQRMGKGQLLVRRVGVLTVHFGIAMLLAASIVRHQTAVEGSLTLFEGQSSNAYHSFHEWEIAVRRQVSDGEIEELRIPGEQFLFSSRVASFHSDRLPFDLVVESSARNGEVRPAQGQLPPEGTPGIGGEGFVLVAKPVESAHEQNRAGAVVSLRSTDDAYDGKRAVVSGMDHAPWTVASADGRELWGIELRKKTYPLPFTITLDDFQAEMYPGTRKPKSFRSRVTVEESGDSRSVMIQMNEPLRSDGLVVYQSSWGPQGAGPNAPLFSGFQVVENVTDQWPLWGCIVISIGMLIAFGQSLLRFIWRETGGAAKSPAVASAAGVLLIGLVGFASTSAPLTAQSLPPDHPPLPANGGVASGSPATRIGRTQAWDAEAVEIFRELPLQSDGRIKPFYTEVSYLLLRLNGLRSFRFPDDERYGALAGTKIGPTEWAMDTLFFPEQADDYRVFLVQTSEVLDAIEVAHEGRKKRDRYSFNELRGGFSNLFRLADRYSQIDAKERSGLQEQVVGLANNVSDYDRLVRSFDAARIVFRTDDTGEVREVLSGGAPAIKFSQLMARFPVVRNRLDTLSRIAEGEITEEQRAERAALTRIVSRANELTRSNALLRWIPPADAREKEWCSTAELVHVLDSNDRPDPESVLKMIDRHEAMMFARSQPIKFLEELEGLDRQLDAWLLARGEGQRLGMEVAYHLADYKYRALLAFVGAFVLVIGCWFRPRVRWLAIPSWVLTAFGLFVLVQGIVVRCLVRQRPPISTLYDTIVFISAAAVLAAVLLELLYRRRVFLSLGTLLGALGMFLAARFELSEGRDTMPTLIAVLDTNFWLATHVTIINLGYAGALLSGFIAHVFLVGQALGLRRKDTQFFRGLGRATYGTVCFAALFTTVGTILGGIWANDSWGRFWGWDPKENGALMIVLWCLAILHARMGNMVRDHGIAMLCVAGNIVVVFSWFHTNLLGVGLHSYGFASGLATAVWSFYALEAGVLAVGWWGARRHAALAANGSATMPAAG